MARLAGFAVLLSLLVPLWASPAWAKDKEGKSDEDEEEEETPAPSEDAFKDEEEDDEPAPQRLQEGDEVDDASDPTKEEEDEFDLGGEEDEEIDFDDTTEQETVKPREEGEDTAQLYRDAQKKYADLLPDEEILRWEQYLQKYPKSLFRDRIEARMEDLSQLMFSERVPGSDRGASSERDAALRELNFATPTRFSGVDPRSHATVGFEVGIPNWAGGEVDLEYQVLRPLSVHGGIDRGFSGGQFVVGGKYALIKSSRTGTIASGMLDLGMNFQPTYVSFRPMLGFGQRVNVAEGLDLQLVGGLSGELQSFPVLRWLGGFNAELRANDTLYLFAETTINQKAVTPQQGGVTREFTYWYCVGSFGLRFVPVKGKDIDQDGRLVMELGASSPYYHRYWGFYQGSVNFGGSYYF